jgi:hypothetical protein
VVIRLTADSSLVRLGSWWSVACTRTPADVNVRIELKKKGINLTGEPMAEERLDYLKEHPPTGAHEEEDDRSPLNPTKVYQNPYDNG